jgi:hypothetical protein
MIGVPHLRRTWRNVLNDFTAGLIGTIMWVGFVLCISMILPDRPTFETERDCRIAMFYCAPHQREGLSAGCTGLKNVQQIFSTDPDRIECVGLRNTVRRRVE